MPTKINHFILKHRVWVVFLVGETDKMPTVGTEIKVTVWDNIGDVVKFH